MAIRILFAALLLCHVNTARAVQISDEPMETQVQSAAANIMFMLDNSGSMDWEFLTEGTDGKFEGNIEYVFDDPGDNNYATSSSNGTILTGSDRAKWKSQWSGYNKMFYNPNTAYLALAANHSESVCGCRYQQSQGKSGQCDTDI